MTTPDRILIYIGRHPGVTGIGVALRYGRPSRTYGKQRSSSVVIADLRKRGLVTDCQRCPTCGRALTRGHKNVPLYLTRAGERYVRNIQKETR